MLKAASFIIRRSKDWLGKKVLFWILIICSRCLLLILELPIKLTLLTCVASSVKAHNRFRLSKPVKNKQQYFILVLLSSKNNAVGILRAYYPIHQHFLLVKSKDLIWVQHHPDSSMGWQMRMTVCKNSSKINFSKPVP